MKTLAHLCFLFVLLLQVALAQTPANIDTPSYQPGDYWKFKVTQLPSASPGSDPQRGDSPNGTWVLRYTSDGFQIDDYTYGLDAFSKNVPTVFMLGSEIPWLEFPLSTAKKWSAKYVGERAARKRSTWNVEFAVAAPESINVAAGTFEAVKISRTDVANIAANARQSVYYYSPITKSVVAGQVTSIYGTRFQLELVEYKAQQ